MRKEAFWFPLSSLTPQGGSYKKKIQFFFFTPKIDVKFFWGSWRGLSKHSGNSQAVVEPEVRLAVTLRYLSGGQVIDLPFKSTRLGQAIANGELTHKRFQPFVNADAASFLS